jgi:cytochrome c oxidase subunit 3
VGLSRGTGEPLRPLTLRAHPVVFGFVLFLASELMFFGALFAAYFDLRSQTAVWPPAGVHLRFPESLAGTIILAASSAAMLFVTRSLQRDQHDNARYGLFATILLAVVFLAIAMHGWSVATFHVDSHAYGSLFYTMTGFHALHVVAGIVLLTALFFGLSRRSFMGDDRALAEGITYYWHFVFVVWVLIWATIYVLR